MNRISIQLLVGMPVLLALAACSGPGPSASPRTAAAPRSAGPKKSEEPAQTDKLTEARIEALSRFASGVSLDMRGRPREAVEEYRKAALADPANEPLVSEVARRLLRARQVDKAIEVLSIAAKVPKAQPMIHVLLGTAYGQQGKFDLAVDSMRKALARDNKFFEAYVGLFNVHLLAKKFPEARAALEEAEKKGAASDGDDLLRLAESYGRYAQARPREMESVKPRAVAVLERARKTVNKEDESELLRLADGFRAFGELKTAAEFYAQVLKQAPNLPGLREKMVEAYLRSDQPEKAREQLNAILRDNPTNPQIYYLLGTIAADSKDDARLKEADEHFQKVIKLKTDFEPAYFDLAQVRLRRKDPEGALAVLRSARTLFGDTFAVEFYTSLAHSEKKDYPAALKSLTSAELIAKTSETNRLTTGLYFQLGAVHERNKDYASAEKYFRKCLELEPEFAEALNYLGYMWAERGEKLKEAHAMIDKALKLEPENGAFLDSMAWVLFQQGKTREALGWIEKSLKFTKEPDPTLFDHLGDIQFKLGRRQQAREAWTRSLELEKNPAVQKKLDAARP